jgi:hypothetical protein
MFTAEVRFYDKDKKELSKRRLFTLYPRDFEDYLLGKMQWDKESKEFIIQSKSKEITWTITAPYWYE